ncbi:MAG TPA: TIGR02217 family protein, partial [Sphingopyxis terrae]|nr:TIGR02217 family protein [Sphingopyxis terrae]
LFDAYCPADWKQRDSEGNPALTGWEPPSTLLSPAHAEAMGWLQLVARALVALAVEAGFPVRFQVGEPWWWVAGAGRLCVYDAATTAALGSASVAIPDVRGALDAGQCAML